MKTNRSRYILAAEILTIVLFHVVKFKQTEKRSGDLVFSHSKNIPLHKTAIESRTANEYMFVNLVK